MARNVVADAAVVVAAVAAEAATAAAVVAAAAATPHPDSQGPRLWLQASCSPQAVRHKLLALSCQPGQKLGDPIYGRKLVMFAPLARGVGAPHRDDVRDARGTRGAQHRQAVVDEQ